MTAIVPLPRPDEIVHGLMGRFARINGCSKESLPKLLRSLGKGQDLPKPLGIHALAKALGRDVSEFVHAHTLMPFLSTFAPAGSHALASAEYSWTVLCKNATRRNGQARFCRTCVANDIASGGFSYWHRRHQLPGIEWCREHDEPLMYVEGANAFDKLPQDFIATAAVCSEPTQALQRSTLRAYCEIAEALLARAKPIPIEVVSSLLRSHATAAGLRTNKREGPEAIAPFVFARCPQAWWQLHFTGPLENAEIAAQRTFTRLMMRTKVPANSAHFYVLALAMLLDTSKHALSALERWKVPEEDRARKKSSRVIWIDARTIDTYIKCEGSARAVAGALGIHKRSAGRGLRAIGLPDVSAIANSKIGDALDEFFNGESLTASCKRHGVSPRQVEDLVRRASCLFESAFRVIRKQKLAHSRAGGIDAIAA